MLKYNWKMGVAWKIKGDKGGWIMDEKRFELREEQLRLFKQWVQTGEVSIYREVLKENRNITVPVIREELVIEKIAVDKENKDNGRNEKESIRIPISEEHIEIVKHTVKLSDISIYKRQFQELQHVEEMVKKERINVKTTGDICVTEKEVKKNM